MATSKATRKGARSATKKAATRAASPSGKKAGSPRKKAAKAKPSKAAKAPGRPGTAGKAEGHEAIRALIARQRPEQKKLLARIDAIVMREVPEARCAIKWSSPMYGVSGRGWFLGTAAFKNNVGVSFFNGVELKPEPPVGDSKRMRGVRYATLEDLDEKQLVDWVRQASSIQGWGKA